MWHHKHTVLQRVVCWNVPVCQGSYYCEKLEHSSKQLFTNHSKQVCWKIL